MISWPNWRSLMPPRASSVASRTSFSMCFTENCGDSSPLPTATSVRTFPVKLLSENESTYIPIGVTHRLENPGKMPLDIIEVQSGSYLGEDDIVRFEDVYQRA